MRGGGQYESFAVQKHSLLHKRVCRTLLKPLVDELIEMSVSSELNRSPYDIC